jgi:hypothetical protein
MKTATAREIINEFIEKVKEKVPNYLDKSKLL